MVRILLVVRPGVPADDRVDLEQANQEDQAALQLVLRNVAHAVVGIIQVEGPLEPEDARHFVVVAFVAQDIVADGSGCSQSAGVAHVVVCRANEIAECSPRELAWRPCRRHERDVVGMGLDRQQHLALVRRSLSALRSNVDVTGLALRRGRSVMQDGRGCQHTGEEITSLHGFPPLMYLVASIKSTGSRRR